MYFFCNVFVFISQSGGLLCNCISIIAGYISDGRLFNRLFIHSTHQYNYCIFNCGNSSIPSYKSLLRKFCH